MRIHLAGPILPIQLNNFEAGEPKQGVCSARMKITWMEEKNKEITGAETARDLPLKLGQDPENQAAENTRDELKVHVAISVRSLSTTRCAQASEQIR